MPLLLSRPSRPSTIRLSLPNVRDPPPPSPRLPNPTTSSPPREFKPWVGETSRATLARPSPCRTVLISEFSPRFVSRCAIWCFLWLCVMVLIVEENSTISREIDFSSVLDQGTRAGKHVLWRGEKLQFYCLWCSIVWSVQLFVLYNCLDCTVVQGYNWRRGKLKFSIVQV